MSVVRYLLDEHIEPALRAQLIRHETEMIVWIIGDPGAPARGTSDPDILLWCEVNDFLLVSRNRASMPVHLLPYVLPRNFEKIRLVGPYGKEVIEGSYSYLISRPQAIPLGSFATATGR